MLLCCGAEGLLEYRLAWQTLSCPLPVPSLMACSGTHRAILDNTEHLLCLNDSLMNVDPGAECLLLWQDRPLVLSGETNAVTLLDPTSGTPLFLAPAGLYPQDMCFLPDDILAVCGGHAGTVLLLHLPELQPLAQIPLPGLPQRLTHQGRWLYVLCATEEFLPQSLLCRVNLRNAQTEVLQTFPGLPGALYADGRSLWICAGEGLYRLRPGERHAHRRLSGLGLVRHIAGKGRDLLLSDPVQGKLLLVRPHQPSQVLMEGDVGQTMYL